jgi:hypothetical protein
MDLVVMKSGSRYSLFFGNGTARIRSEPSPAKPVPTKATPPPPEKSGSRQHHDISNLRGATAPGMLAAMAGASSESLSDSSTSSVMRFGEVFDPGAHQNAGRSLRARVFGGASGVFGLNILGRFLR